MNKGYLKIGSARELVKIQKHNSKTKNILITIPFLTEETRDCIFKMIQGELED